MPGAIQAIYRDSHFLPRSLSVLIVDDDRFTREACRQMAEQLACSVSVADSVNAAVRHLNMRRIHLVLADIRLFLSEGGILLRSIKARPVEPEVVLLSAHDYPASNLQAGGTAYTRLKKPLQTEELRALLGQVARRVPDAQGDIVAENGKPDSGFRGVIGQSAQMQKLFRMIAKVGPSRHPVLLVGEKGTGKENLARAIHSCGRAEGPFVVMDCSSSSAADLELQLFGSAKPSAHSVRPKEGLLVLARGGTIFLDGLMALPLDLQGKLLRALQEKTIQPLGSTRSLSIDVRVIAATDRDLDSAVQHGSFRRDLYLRLNVVSLHLPPLRERRQDVPLLVQHILGQISSGKSSSYSVSPDAMKILMAYDWPGNVRELENCLERAAAITSGSILGSADFISLLQRNNSHPDQSSPESRILPLAEVEKQAILGTLEQLNGDKLMAARLLGIGKTTLYRKLKEYGVWRPWMDSSSAGK